MWFWGVDTSTKAIDIVAMRAQSGRIVPHTIRLAAPAQVFLGGPSLAHTLSQLDDWFNFLPQDPSLGLNSPWWSPSLIVVESPFVRGGGQSLLMTYGCILGTLARRARCPVVEVASSTWKMTSAGGGRADKAQVMRHARAAGYEGDRQDSADALCMAMHAQHLWSVGERHGDVAF